MRPLEESAAQALREAQAHDPRGAFERLRESFFEAILRGNAESALATLAFEPRLAKEERSGVSALHWACAEARLEPLIGPLLESGADPERDASHEGRGASPLGWAVESGNRPGAQTLLRLRPQARAHQGEPLSQALREAARRGYGDVCLELMARGADPLAKPADSGAEKPQPAGALETSEGAPPEPAGACAMDLLAWSLGAFPPGPSRQKGMEALAAMESAALAQEAGGAPSAKAAPDAPAPAEGEGESEGGRNGSRRL
jgi:ankyrin repeat protein